MRKLLDYPITNYVHFSLCYIAHSTIWPVTGADCKKCPYNHCIYRQSGTEKEVQKKCTNEEKGND